MQNNSANENVVKQVVQIQMNKYPTYVNSGKTLAASVDDATFGPFMGLWRSLCCFFSLDTHNTLYPVHNTQYSTPIQKKAAARSAHIYKRTRNTVRSLCCLFKSNTEARRHSRKAPLRKHLVNCYCALRSASVSFYFTLLHIRFDIKYKEYTNLCVQHNRVCFNPCHQAGSATLCAVFLSPIAKLFSSTTQIIHNIPSKSREANSEIRLHIKNCLFMIYSKTATLLLFTIRKFSASYMNNFVISKGAEDLQGVILLIKPRFYTTCNLITSVPLFTPAIYFFLYIINGLKTKDRGQSNLRAISYNNAFGLHNNYTAPASFFTQPTQPNTTRGFIPLPKEVISHTTHQCNTLSYIKQKLNPQSAEQLRRDDINGLWG